MRIVFINSVCGIRSTGRICADLAKNYEQQGYECKIAYGRIETVPKECKKYAIRIGTNLGVKLHAVSSRLFDNHGLASYFDTKKFLKWLEKYNPDVLWLHNIHGYYINYKLLFSWIKKHPNLEVKWTLHDCWAFTGHCSYFSEIGCYKWKEQCKKCPQNHRYPTSIWLDNSKRNFKIKKDSFTSIKNMTIYTPSQWLQDLVKSSFLREYPVEVLYNEVDKSIFKPTESDFRKNHNLIDKKIILGVASTWDDRKGLKIFYSLAEMLGNDYKMVLVGLTEAQIALLPPNIIGIARTNSTKELAEIYTAADVFVNPSKEETFGLTTVEALYCGTKAIVYKDTACEEIAKKYGGIVVEQSAEAIYEAIHSLIK
jgi:glycosyltransferase involved in cell wall biosynthesis